MSILKHLIYSHHQTLYKRLIVEDEYGNVNFHIDNQIHVLPIEYLAECFYNIRELFINDLVIGRHYNYVKNSVDVAFAVIASGNDYTGKLTLKHHNAEVVCFEFNMQTILLQIGSKVFSVRHVRYLPHNFRTLVDGIQARYAKWLKYELNPPEYVGMSIHRKFLYVYFERYSDHYIVGTKECVRLPSKLVEDALHSAIKKLENFEVSNTDSDKSFHEDSYISKVKDIDCIIKTCKTIDSKEPLVSVTFEYKSNHSFSFGVKLDDFVFSEDFIIRVGRERTDECTLNSLLPYFINKYSYIKTLLKLTEEHRFKSLRQNI